MDHSNSTMNPTGGAGDRRGATQPALHEDLMEAALSPANLHQAWRRVKSNRGAPGIDGVHIEDFPAYAREHWPTIRQSLDDGRYQPQPVRRVSIPKPDGGERALGIPTVVDRVIQQAIAQVMSPIFDPQFSASSYGFRPKIRLPPPTPQRFDSRPRFPRPRFLRPRFQRTLTGLVQQTNQAAASRDRSLFVSS